MRYKLNWSLQDGKLDWDCGRIVILKGKGVRSVGPSIDHNDLISKFSSFYKINRSEVMSGVYRFYWKPSGTEITISPVRRIDEEWVMNNAGEFSRVVDSVFGNAGYS